MYDITKATSLKKAKMWVNEPQWQANPNIVIVLASDKINLMQPL
jgi:Ras-related protein Rab-5C